MWTQKTGQRPWHHWGHKKQRRDTGIIGYTKNSPETRASLGTQKTGRRQRNKKNKPHTQHEKLKIFIIHYSLLSNLYLTKVTNGWSYPIPVHVVINNKSVFNNEIIWVYKCFL
jgi:hypothetical protein